VPAVEPLRAAAAAIHGRAAPAAPALGLRQPRHRLLGAAEAARPGGGGHAAQARPRLLVGHRGRPDAPAPHLTINNFAGATNAGLIPRDHPVFITEAHAQTAPAPTGGTDSIFGGGLMGMLPFILMFVVLYFIMIRPQMKRQ